MANHGYLPRSGKGISFTQIARALVECYGLRTFFAYFLSYGGAFLLRQWGPICLSDIARHGAVEHDASLAHKDTPPGGVYAPLEVNEEMLDQSMGWMTEEGDGMIDAQDVGHARVNREKYSKPLTDMYAEVARGEMGIALVMFAPEGSPPGAVPAEYFREWLGSERLPLGGTWRPTRKTGLFATINQTKQMKKTMEETRKAEGGKADGGVLYVEPEPAGAGKSSGTSPTSYGTLRPANGHGKQAPNGLRSTSSSTAVASSTEVEAEDAKLIPK